MGLVGCAVARWARAGLDGAVPSWIIHQRRDERGRWPRLVLCKWLCWMGSVVWWVAGCASIDPDFEATALRRPLMPTVTAPMEPPPPVSLADGEIVAEALARARRRDVAATVRIVSQVVGPRRRADLQLRVVTALAEEDVGLAEGLALAWPEFGSRAEGLEWVARWRATASAEAALSWLEELMPEAPVVTVQRVLAEVLVERDARGAMRLLCRRPLSARRETTLSFAAAVWARRDEAAALAWWRELPVDALRDRLTSAIGFEIAQRNPRGAIELADSLPPSRDRGLLIGAIAQTWVATDPRSAWTWAQQLPMGDSRWAALAGAETGVGLPNRLREAAVKERPAMGGLDQWAGSRVGGGGVGPLADEDFETWRRQQVRTFTRDEAILEYVRQRGALDLGTIGTWLLTLAGGPARENAMELYWENLLAGSPVVAANWLRALPRSALRDALMERAARKWLGSDPERAEWWRQGAPLAPGQPEWAR